MKHKSILLALGAVVLVLAVSVGSAMGYFSTYATAQGGKITHLGATTTIEETEVSNWTKHIVVSSDEGSQPVYIRVRAFAGSQYELTYSGEGWTLGSDGAYYYDDILTGGASTAELLVKIGDVPEDIKEFNVIVIYESTPVLYDAGGSPYADWSQSVVLEEGGRNG